MKIKFPLAASVGLYVFLGTVVGHAEPPPDEISLAPVNPLQGVLIAENQGFAIGHPQQIAGPNVRVVLVSPDSRYVLTLCQEKRASLAEVVRGKIDDTPGEELLSCYDKQTRRSTVLWRQTLPVGESGLLLYGLRLRGWMTTGGKNATFRALASLWIRTVDPSGDKQKDTAFTLFIDPAMGSVRSVPMAWENGTTTSPSPTQPFAALLDFVEGSRDKEMRFLRPDGSVTDPIALPAASTHFWFNHWSEDGTEIRATDGKDYYAVNPATKTVRKIPTPPKNADGEPEFPSPYANPVSPVDIPLRLSGRKAYEKKAAPVLLINQAGTEQVTLLADGEPVAILPNGSGALVRTNGYLYLCPIQTVPQTAVVEWRHRDSREQTLAQAKEIGGALFLFWDKNDHVLPPDGAGLQASLEPYISQATRDALSRFVYAPPTNRAVTDFKELRKIRLGHLPASAGDGVVIVFPTNAVWEAKP